MGADNAVTSRDLRILVDQAAEPVASSDADVVLRRRGWDLGVGWVVDGVVQRDLRAADRHRPARLQPIASSSPAGDICTTPSASTSITTTPTGRTEPSASNPGEDFAGGRVGLRGRSSRSLMRCLRYAATLNNATRAASS